MNAATVPDTAEMVPTGTIQPATDSPHAAARTEAHTALEEARAQLASLRADRDALNDRIRLLDAEVDTLAVVVSVFDRRRKTELAAARPVRRTRKPSKS